MAKFAVAKLQVLLQTNHVQLTTFECKYSIFAIANVIIC